MTTDAEPSLNITPLRRSTRSHTKQSFLRDYQCNSTAHSLYTINNYLSYDLLASSHTHFLMNVSAAYEPSYFHQAIKLSQWKQAMDSEIAAMERTNTWTIVPLPPGKHTVGCKWVYRIKHHANGTIDKYKARLVAKGYSQQEGIDFIDTFSPVAKIATVKLLLSLVAAFNWTMSQMDVNNAFLNGELFEEVYMSLPLGYYADLKSSSTAPLACKLNKSIYGLKQASR